MKKFKCLSLMFCGSALICSSAFAQFNLKNTYFRIDAGYSWATNPHLTDDPALAGACVICAADGISPVAINNVNNSMLIGAGAGYRFSENFRSDITYLYRGGYEISDHDGMGTAISTNIKSNSLFLNAYFDFPSKWPRLMPYIGGGVGWANNQLGTVTYARTSINGGTINNFAWNVGVGVGFEISKGMILDVGYRYVDLGKLRLDTQPALGFADYSAAGQLRANELQLGLRF